MWEYQVNRLHIGNLKRSIKKKYTKKKTAPNWRINQKHFVSKIGGRSCEPGAVNFSAGWLGQGHTVSLSSFK